MGHQSQTSSRLNSGIDATVAMAEQENFTSSADIFLQDEVSRLGSSPGLRSLPPNPTRDFLLLTWGPIVYRTFYAPDTKQLLQAFLRCLNDAVSRSLRQTLSGSEEQLHLLETTYASRVFSTKSRYDGINEEKVREAFHDYKVSLAIPAADLPSRLRVCLMVDKAVLSQFRGMLSKSGKLKKDADLGRSWVKLVEENFPDGRFGDRPYVATVERDESDGVGDYRNNRGEYHGWTMVALLALVEVLDGLRQMKYLVEYHREGRVYMGEGKWSSG
ncbi:uncharacterized protein N7459_007589 [Penicillium hispanicum]|uniref:uncharacterized protein n=1 Tax=Penicillium hispanicum TaxID=1080232 RepID=UPI00254173CE|nr:uncharacterized protein N7459_007589 [Penicillium hispanicum]KAJ5578625.1 hypothetical protein N7459_007589 [Penicillium hispanicum]